MFEITESLQYHWQAMLLSLGCVIFMTKLSKFIIARAKLLDETKAVNAEMDRTKKAKSKYPPVIKQNNIIGAVMLSIQYFLITPFIANFDDKSALDHIVDIVVILMIYDFFYYLTHRFLFHGNGYFKTVHGLHHQARDPSYVDNYYVHPLETVIGLGLFMSSLIISYFLLGAFNPISLAIAYFAYTQINVINHIKIDIPQFPYRTLSWMSKKHHVHHINMNKGNYASLSLIFDKLFGTYDAH